MSLLLGAVASISLIVGKIGILMAIGAKQCGTLLQSLTEAVLLTTCCGIIGMGQGRPEQWSYLKTWIGRP